MCIYICIRGGECFIAMCDHQRVTILFCGDTLVLTQPSPSLPQVLGHKAEAMDRIIVRIDSMNTLKQWMVSPAERVAMKTWQLFKLRNMGVSS